MSNEWMTTTLGKLADVFDGPHATPAKTEDGPVFLGISSLDNGRITPLDLEHLSEEDYARWTKRVEPRPGDLVFSYETRLGEAALIPSGLRCCLGRRMGLLRPRAGVVDGRFLLYAYLGPEFQETLRSRTIHGSTVDRIPLTDLPMFPITVPRDIDEQRAIAHILGSLDDKIELNRRMNETLEEMARALFRSWFVDFDPVRAKAEGRDTGLPSHIADLFPDSFEESELGEIPKGWPSTKLRDTCSAIFSGGTPITTEATYWNGDIRWLSSGETRNAFVTDTEKSITKEGVLNSSTRFASRSSTVIASAGQGKTRGQTSLLLIDAYVNQSVVVLQADHAVSSDLFLFFDLARRYEEFRRVSDSSSSRGSLTTKILSDIPVLVPPKTIVDCFERVVSPMIARIRAGCGESRTLGQLRDALLPKLISGELRVPDAERLLEAAV